MRRSAVRRNHYRLLDHRNKIKNLVYTVLILERQTVTRRISVNKILCLSVQSYSLFVVAFAATAADVASTGPFIQWGFEQDLEGWQPVKDCRLTVEDGVLTIAGTGRDPHLTTVVDAPAGWKEFSFRTRFKGRRDGQLYWTTKRDQTTSEQRSVRFTIRSRDLAWSTHRVYFKPDAPLTSIRLDPHARPGKNRDSVDRPGKSSATYSQCNSRGTGEAAAGVQGGTALLGPRPGTRLVGCADSGRQGASDHFGPVRQTVSSNGAGNWLALTGRSRSNRLR